VESVNVSTEGEQGQFILRLKQKISELRQQADEKEQELRREVDRLREELDQEKSRKAQNEVVELKELPKQMPV
jgi:acetyl-CoA carboxylase alpha subunit